MSTSFSSVSSDESISTEDSWLPDIPEVSPIGHKVTRIVKTDELDGLFRTVYGYLVKSLRDEKPLLDEQKFVLVSKIHFFFRGMSLPFRVGICKSVKLLTDVINAYGEVKLNGFVIQPAPEAGDGDRTTWLRYQVTWREVKEYNEFLEQCEERSICQIGVISRDLKGSPAFLVAAVDVASQSPAKQDSQDVVVRAQFPGTTAEDCALAALMTNSFDGKILGGEFYFETPPIFDLANVRCQAIRMA
ncbi:unnamed protein product [Caenorhabditis auriculariae]|uniref:Uncharacterized protein n=1 Tax=Caenorhabditis auriculariae TaxID=2777116 RepID=A0A8S1HQ16_9PELO|nr:unnamed protein product [Caenorhabditis auriculariae]